MSHLSRSESILCGIAGGRGYTVDVDRIRTYLHSLPHVLESEQFGGLVFWVGDKAIGGKMFAWIRLEQTGNRTRVLSYPVGPERFHELLEIDGVFPAPYVARLFWVAVERWDVFRAAQWESELRAAYTLTFNKLPPKVRAVLALPPAQQKRLITERKKLLAAKAAKPTSKKSGKRPS
jgi:predicted DNA-binding protein (MmcQ/YjbR family)